MPDLRLTLIGGFELELDGEIVHLPLACQRLVAYLALHDRSLLRVHVAGKLWLDATEERSCANLRSALWRLRRPGPAVVEASTSHVGISKEVTIDLHEVVALARRIVEGATPEAQLDVEREPLCGDLLPDWYDDWVLAERERLRQLRLHALETLSDDLARAGRFAEAVDTALRAVHADPLRESAHRALIRAHLAEGNPGEAFRQYRSFADRLRDELDMEPSALMQELVAEFASA